MILYNIIFVFLFTTCLLSCQGSKNVMSTANTKLEIPLSQYGDFSRGAKSAHLVFSGDSKQICLWWSQGLVNFSSPAHWIVFSTTNADLLASSADDAVEMRQLLRDFPFLAPTVRWGDCFTNATAYYVNEDARHALRASPNISFAHTPEGARRLSPGALPGDNLIKRFSFDILSLRLPSIVAMIHLGEDKKVIWSANIFDENRVVKFGLLGSSENVEKRILALCEGKTGYVLNYDTGDILATFTYGPIETEQELLKRKRRFTPLRSKQNFSFEFDANRITLDPHLRFIGVGCRNDRRVRVISLQDFSVVHEFHADENPYWPPGGSWKTVDVRFSPSGNYLIIESLHGGRLASGKRVTEVIDMKSWNVIKEIHDLNTHSIAISSDDNYMAYIQNNIMKILPFNQ